MSFYSTQQHPCADESSQYYDVCSVWFRNDGGAAGDVGCLPFSACSWQLCCIIQYLQTLLLWGMQAFGQPQQGAGWGGRAHVLAVDKHGACGCVGLCCCCSCCKADGGSHRMHMRLTKKNTVVLHVHAHQLQACNTSSRLVVGKHRTASL